MTRSASLLVILTLGANLARAKPIRTVIADGSLVIPIHIALGYSTILELGSRPTAVVLGDQDAFKVEYVGASLTIKPLAPRAKTNLFVFVDYDRFNFSLVTGPRESADYLVRVRRKEHQLVPPVRVEGESAPTIFSPLTTKKLHLLISKNGIRFHLLSLSSPKSHSSLIVDFLLEQKVPAMAFDGHSFLVSQEATALPIESIYLDTSEPLSTKGTLVLRQSYLLPHKRIVISLLKKDGTKEVSLSLPWPLKNR